MQCQILRTFDGPEGPYAPGAIVDTSTWRPRNRRVLIERRYIQPLPPYGVINPDNPLPPDDDTGQPGRRAKERSHGN